MLLKKIKSLFNNKNSWIVVTDQTARGGKSSLSLKESESRRGEEFSAHLVPIQGNTGPVGFALAKKKINLKKENNEVKEISFVVYAKKTFVLSVALINKDGTKYQCDLKIKKGKNSYCLKPDSFILSKWGKSYEDKLSSFEDVSYFENGILFSRQGVETYTDFKAQWTLEINEEVFC